MEVDSLRNRVPGLRAEQTDSELLALRHGIQRTVLEVRRVVEGLRPPALDELGLSGAVEQLARRLTTPGAAAGGDGVQPTVQATVQLSGLPELPEARRTRLENTFALSAYDARVITSEVPLAEYFEAVVGAGVEPKTAANWVMGDVMTSFNQTGQFPVSPARLAALAGLVRDGVVSHQAAKRVYAELGSTEDAPRAVAERLGLVQVSDQDSLGRWVDEVLEAHPGEVARFRGGEAKLMGFFVGQVMKKSQGKADPKGVQPVLAERLTTAAPPDSSDPH